MTMTTILVKSKLMQQRIMKNLFKSMMLVAVAAMAFTSCSKELQESVEVAPMTCKLTVVSDMPQSRTAHNGTGIVWSTDDQIAVACEMDGAFVNQNGEAGGKLYYSEKLAAGGETAEFTLGTFTSAVSGELKFFGLYPSSLRGSDNDFTSTTRNVTIPTEQTPAANSFDSKADLMVGISEVYNGTIGTDVTSVNMAWYRQVAHNCITIKTLNGFTAGETLKTVTLTAQEGANVTGKQSVDFTLEEDVVANGSVNNVVLNGTNCTISNEGTVTVWAVTMPFTATELAVVVETDLATYTRNIASCNLTFEQNTCNTLTINMATATREAKVVADYSGDYAIVALRESAYSIMTNNLGTASTKRYQSEAYTGSLESATLEANKIWTVTKQPDGSYTICSKDSSIGANKYLGWTSGNSGALVAEASAVKMEAIDNGDGTYTFEYAASDKTRYLSLNTAADYFAFYGVGQILNLYLVPATVYVAPETVYTLPFEESFSGTMGKFSINEVSGYSGVWTTNGEYIKATAYVSSTNNAAESWLVSPKIDLSGAEKPVLKFEHVWRYAAATSDFSLIVTNNDGTSWTEVAINEWSTGSDWTFVPANVDLSAYKNQTIKFAFKYTSTTTKAGTWEIKNLSLIDGSAPVLKAEETAITVPAAGVTNATLALTVENIATVNVAYTGCVTAASVSGNTLTYSVAANTTSNEKTGTITLSADGVTPVVINLTQQAAGAAVEKTATFNFSTMGLTNAVSYTDFTDGDIDLLFALGTNTNNNDPKYYNTGTGMRMYVGNTLTISGGKITKIVITCSASSYAKLALNTGESGTLSLSGAVYTWTNNSGDSEVVLKGTDTGRYQKIEVTYTAE